jgi:signal peptidase I
MENDNENERLNEDNKNSIKTEKKERVVNEVLEWIFCIVIAVVLAFLIKGFVGTFTTVKQESMYPTLKNDQRLWLDRTVRTFNRRI